MLKRWICGMLIASILLLSACSSEQSVAESTEQENSGTSVQDDQTESNLSADDDTGLPSTDPNAPVSNTPGFDPDTPVQNDTSSDSKPSVESADTPAVVPGQPSAETADQYTYEDYHNMTPEQQQYFVESFADMAAFFDWYNTAKETYEKEHGAIEIGNGNEINLDEVIK